ncbi:DNA-directed RNA polymerase III 47 kDa polypeptide [Streptomyces sp. KY75]|nr:DNA-directed RNA polymerase III 47 kDa polypeptide [Streptomyces sp. KY75]CAD5990941.1 DNA-directed RNA polymerase III 47 kDa polypeptide [Streptomyces sp. KY70]
MRRGCQAWVSGGRRRAGALPAVVAGLLRLPRGRGRADGGRLRAAEAGMRTGREAPAAGTAAERRGRAWFTGTPRRQEKISRAVS